MLGQVQIVNMYMAMENQRNSAEEIVSCISLVVIVVREYCCTYQASLTTVEFKNMKSNQRVINISTTV
jgi:hypothetical protein